MTHDPPEQVSLTVQALPSLHGAVLLTWMQPVAGLHESSVQTLLSSQFGGGPLTQLPAEQVSFIVQALPSSQGLLLLVNTQKPLGPQVSVVQTLPSLHWAAVVHSMQPGGGRMIGVP